MTKKTALKWIKFFPSDWLGDAALRTCSPAARGLWIDMLCLMSTASPRGHLKLGTRKIDTATLAGLTNITPRRVEILLAELQKASVFSVTNRGTIYCRKMVREEKWSKKGEKMAAARWSQATEKKGEFPTSNAASMTPESKSPRIRKSLPSEPGVARARPGAKEPTDYSKEPIEPTEALIRSRLVRKYTH